MISTPNGLAITPDGNAIAVTDYGGGAKDFNGACCCWSAARGRLVRGTATPGTPTKDVVFSPDGRWLAAVLEPASMSGIVVGEEVAARACRSSGRDRSDRDGA